MSELAKNEITPIQVGRVYVLSSDDVDLIYSCFTDEADWFWELLESRRVTFPNPYYRGPTQQSQEF